MTASTRTPIENIDLDVSSQSHLGYENRRFLGVFQIHALSHKLLANDFASKTRWPDVDTVAVHVKSIEPSDSARGYRIYVTDESKLMLRIHCDTLPFGFGKTTPSKRRIVHEDPALRETLNKPVMGKLVFIKEEALL
jgi:hypothetical protein